MASDPKRAFLAGGGTCGELARAVDWSATPLGPPDGWPSALKTIVGVLLHSRHPMFLWWGPELIQIYNDAYLPSFGRGKHPAAMGQRGAECWQEIWPIIFPQIDDVMQRGVASWNEDQLVPIFRNGCIEEVYWTYGYSPVLTDDGSIGGTLVVCTETTRRVVAERRLQLLRALAVDLAAADDVVELSTITTRVLGSATHDVPFAIVHTDGRAVAIGTDDATAAAIDETLRDRRGEEGPFDLPQPVAAGPWPEPITRAFVAPLEPSSGNAIVFGLSPRLPFDDEYRSFLQHVAEHLVNARRRARIEAERERLLADAEAAGRAKDEFLAMLGHELRNPLAPIITALQLMKLKGGDELARGRDIIERQARHLVHLVDDLLDVSRVAQGKIELKKTRMPLAEIVARAVETATPLFEERAHSLQVDVPTEGLDVDADPLRLTQVVANLLTNAAKYTEPGGHVSVVATRIDGEIVLRVTDDGAGILKENLPRLFDAFFQGPRARDRSEGGLGLGLALVRSFTALHGGTVSVSSEGPGRGSTFEVRLPVAALPARASSASDPGRVSSERPPATTRVLMVDDNEDISALFAAFLGTFGFDVRTAHDGPTALELAATFRPHVAVLDIGLPVMDGYELASRLRERLGPAAPRLIAMTGYGQKEDRENSLRSGFEQHLVKPVDGYALVTAINGEPS